MTVSILPEGELAPCDDESSPEDSSKLGVTQRGERPKLVAHPSILRSTHGTATPSVALADLSALNLAYLERPVRQRFELPQPKLDLVSETACPLARPEKGGFSIS